MDSFNNSRWWQSWFSPASVMLAITVVGIIWATSGRMTSLEASRDADRRDVTGLSARVGALESSIVTKEWLSREISYQRETYASKASVDLISQRLEEFQRQLNTIDAGVKALATDRRAR
jgi:hypothetical protein